MLTDETHPTFSGTLIQPLDVSIWSNLGRSGKTRLSQVTGRSIAATCTASRAEWPQAERDALRHDAHGIRRTRPMRLPRGLASWHCTVSQRVEGRAAKYWKAATRARSSAFARIVSYSDPYEYRRHAACGIPPLPRLVRFERDDRPSWRRSVWRAPRSLHLDGVGRPALRPAIGNRRDTANRSVGQAENHIDRHLPGDFGDQIRPATRKGSIANLCWFANSQSPHRPRKARYVELDVEHVFRRRRELHADFIASVRNRSIHGETRLPE